MIERPAPTPWAIRSALDRLLDSRFGVVTRLLEDPREAGSPEFFHFYAEACHTQALGGMANFRGGGGASLDRDTALAKTVGEAVERYCAALYAPADFPLTTYEAADFACVDPADFALYRADQYDAGRIEFVPFTKELPVRWTPALDVETLRIVYVPAGMVFVPYMYDRSEGELPIAQPISTGMACGEGYHRALVSAACEAIERDAFSIFWQAKLAPRRVCTESLDEQNVERLLRLSRGRYDVTLFDITTDIPVPSVLAVARHGDESQPALVVAAATHPNAQMAVRKCLDELDLTRAWCKRLKAIMRPVEDIDAIVVQEDHLRFWCEASNASRADWLFASQERTALTELPGNAADDPAEQLAYVSRALHATGLRLLAVDLTSPDIGELGLCVVRAVVPGLHPLVMGHVKRALGGRRLYEVPARLGYGLPKLDLDDDNPHPFP